MLLVFAPAVMDAPVGKVHTYPVALVMAGTLYVTPVCPWQTVWLPVMEPAAAGSGLTVIGKFSDGVPLQLPLVPYTLILPLLAVLEKFTVILLVFVPAVMEAPEGRLQTYPVALAMAGTL
jgi:hypothetical protein